MKPKTNEQKLKAQVRKLKSEIKLLKARIESRDNLINALCLDVMELHDQKEALLLELPEEESRDVT